MMSFDLKRSSFIALMFFGIVLGASSGQAAVAVPTYHYDTYRTGWNNQETTLTATSFPSNFGIVATQSGLDDQVDAQPLFVPKGIVGPDLVYVATAGNTVYALDASTGAILLKRNLGSPVPAPIGCRNNGPNVGITGTPVIDLTTHILYLIAYINGFPPTYKLYALNLSDLSDAHSPVTVAASHTLTNGSVYTFNATFERQRPGLLELNGNIYAGFGSFCDYRADASRGWVLGWSASTLAPLSTNRLDDTQGTSPTSYFLTSVWMSGYGLSGGGTGAGARIMFATGNSDCNYYVNPEQCPSASTYHVPDHIQESVVKTDANPANLLGIFTPSNVFTMDKQDADLGSGGVMQLPTQSGTVPYLAVAAGKDGRLFLLDRLNMGAPLDAHQLAPCWCGPSYFVGSDGVPRIVTSHGASVSTWQLVLSPSPHLVQEGSANIVTGQDEGFFTVVSSNGTTAGSAIIWAVGRPKTTTAVSLYAFAATASGGTYKQLFSSTAAGSWPNTTGNANIVPVVANGRVYVASNKELVIFGVNGSGGGGNLVQNPDFEAGASLTPWTVDGSPDAAGVDTTPSHAHSGNNAADIWNGSTAKKFVDLAQTIAVTPGANYTFTGWVDASNTTGGMFGVRTTGGTLIAAATLVNSDPGPSTHAADYRQYTVTFNSSGNSSVVGFIGYTTPGSASFINVDDVSLITNPSPAAQIAFQASPVASPVPVASLSTPHVITGTLLAIDGSILTLETRGGKTARIDDSQAAANKQMGLLSVGRPLPRKAHRSPQPARCLRHRLFAPRVLRASCGRQTIEKLGLRS